MEIGTGMQVACGRFPTTHWSAVLAAADSRDPRSPFALSEICEAYWRPLYAFVRRQGADADEAGDLVQGYFARLLEKNYLGDVRRDRGRFRAFLLVSLKHYLANERDRSRARKRSPRERLLSIDAEQTEERLRIALADTADPEQLFERQWALTLLERALDRLGEEAESAGAKGRFERLKGFLTENDGAAASYQEVAAELATTEGAVKTAVYRLRRRFGELLRDEVAGTVVHPDEVDAEIRHLLRSLAS
jgi:RNA polymerase sigma-70 factor (ECF subfamily)